MDTLTLAVCPHVMVRNPSGWQRLIQYLSQHLGLRIRFSLILDNSNFRRSNRSADLVYANASDALTLLDDHGFAPLVRPTDSYDEALLIARHDAPALSIEPADGARLAIVEGTISTRLALRMLRARGVAPGELLPYDTWLDVVQAVGAGEALYGIVYREAFEALPPQGRAQVQVIAATSERCAFHLFCGGNRLGPHAGALADALVAMAGDGAGNDVLAELQLVGWRPVGADELAAMRELLG